MMSRSLSLLPNRSRPFGVGLLLVLLGTASMSVQGCEDEPTPQKPPVNCSAADLANNDPHDCQKPVCQDGTVVNQPDDTETPDDANDCTTDTCSGGMAQHAPAMGSCSVGGAAGTCANGICKITCVVDADCNDDNPCTKDSCDTASMSCSFADDPASYNDGKECTVDTCVGGMEKHDNAPAGTPCGATKSSQCDGNGVCKGCTTDADCPDEPCIDHFCDVATKLCQSLPKPDGDLMDDMVGDCQIPGCMGGVVVKNINDADLPNDNNDCTVDACNAGAASNEPAASETMCSTGVCDGNSACVQCVNAANCMGDFSCSMNQCFDCNDGTKNGTESDIDCGSDCATKCADGKTCGMDTDCFYGTCANNVCVSCFDGAMNSTESDIDCGGVCGPTCGVNKKCNSGADCTTGVCNGGTKSCAAPTCTDTVKNGTETDVDCGGACPKCAAGKMCKVDSDCVGGTKCVAGICG